jgi:hypothetical protein
MGFVFRMYCPLLRDKRFRLDFIMVFGENLGEWCKWGTRMYFNELKGPIFDVKTGKNDVETVVKQRSSEKTYVSTGFMRRPDSAGVLITPVVSSGQSSPM